MFGRAFKKSLVVLFLVAFLAMSIPVQPVVSAAPKIDTSKKVELEWYVVGDGQQADTDLVLNKVNEYLKSKINATLKLKTFKWGEDFENKMAAKTVSGERYDITFTANWHLNYRYWAAKGYFIDITDKMDIYAPKTKALLGEKLLKGAEVNGRVYGIPTFSKDSATGHGVLLNKKMVSKYKVDTSKIKKLEDLESIFKLINVDNPEILDFYPFNYSGESIYNILNYDKIYDSKIPGAVERDGKSTKVVNDFDTPEAKSLFNLMKKWNKKGYINMTTSVDYYTSWPYEYFENNVSNTFAFYSDLSPTICQDISNKFGIDTVPIELSNRTMTTLNATGAMQAISKSSENPERALMLLELVNTDSYLSNLINFGIEGVHYKKTGNNTISQLAPRYEKYNPCGSWMFGNQSIVYSLPGDNPSVTSEKNLKEYINNAVASPLLGFSFDTNPVIRDLGKFIRITDKYINDLSIGKNNSSKNLKKMNAEFKKAGLEKVLNEMQKQVDAFVKADY